MSRGCVTCPAADEGLKLTVRMAVSDDECAGFSCRCLGVMLELVLFVVTRDDREDCQEPWVGIDGIDRV